MNESSAHRRSIVNGRAIRQLFENIAQDLGRHEASSWLFWTAECSSDLDGSLFNA